MEDVTKITRITNWHRLKLNISAGNESGHHKEEIAPIEIENKQVEQKWVIWNEGQNGLMWMKLLECARHLKDGWLQDECCCRHLRTQEFTQDKTRREEDTSLSHSLTKLVKVFYSKKSILLLKVPFMPLYRDIRPTKSTREGTFEESPSSLFLNWLLYEQEKEKSLLLALS